VVARAKQEYYDGILVGATTTEVYRFMAWTKGQTRRATPPIRRPNGQLALTPQEKAEAFAEAFFPERHYNVERIQPDDPPPRARRNNHELTFDEVQTAIRGTSNTSAPGLSGSNYMLLKWAIEAEPCRFLTFYSACIRVGYHPQRFRSAAVPVIGKPRKSDMTSPRSYRPIALLECMGKVLEKIQSAQILYEVGKFNLMPSNQFGGRDKSSVIDAGLSLVHDIQTAWKKNMVMSVLAFDIKGFFDHVNHERMVAVLENLGFSVQLCSWVRSFLSNRTVSIRVDGHTMPPVNVACGIPQGSPVSPILATLYTSFMFQIVEDNPGACLFAYVDDGLLGAVSPTPEENVSIITPLYRKCIDYLRRIGLGVDDPKTECMHFTGRKRRGSPPFLLPKSDDSGVYTLNARMHMRWLGLFFDSKLDWKHHVDIMTTRAYSTVASLRMLANSTRGLSLLNLRLIYITVVLPVLTFGAAVWHTGIRQKALIKRLQLAQNAAIRHISGCFRTTPLDPIHHITSILPIDIYLNRLLDNAAIRLQSLPSTSQPMLRLGPEWKLYNGHLPILYQPRKPVTVPHSNLRQLAARTDCQGERLQPYTVAPWEIRNPWGHRLRFDASVPATKEGKRERVKIVKDMCSRAARDPKRIIVFTDGSRHAPKSHKRTGAAFAIYYGGEVVASGKLGLGRRANVYDGEMAALAAAARKI
jgi:hypothetical protein